MTCEGWAGPGLLRGAGASLENITVGMPFPATWGLANLSLRCTPGQLLGTGQAARMQNPGDSRVWPRLSRGLVRDRRKPGPIFSPKPFCS